MRFTLHRWGFALLASTGLLPAAERGPVSFTRDLAPILSSKCVGCHQPSKSKGGYQAHNFEALLKPGTSKEVPVVAGKPAPSGLIQRLRATDPDDRMPQKEDPLPPAQIALFERWISEGARFDGPNPQTPLSELIPRPPHPKPPALYPQPIPITALGFAGDTNTLLVSGYHEVLSIDLATGTIKQRIGDIPERTQALLPLTNGAGVVVAGGAPGRSGEVRLIDPEEHRPARVLLRSPEMILAAALSPDGKWLVAGGADQAIRIVDLSTGSVTKTIEQHSDWVTGLAFDPASQKIASASRDKSSRVFSAPGGELITSFLDATDPLQAVAFSADGKHALSGGRGRQVFVWDPQEGQKSATLATGDEEVLGLHATADRIWILTRDGRIREHAAGEKRELLQDYPSAGHRLTSFTLDIAHRRLAGGSVDGWVTVWTLGATNPIIAFLAEPLKAR